MFSFWGNDKGFLSLPPPLDMRNPPSLRVVGLIESINRDVVAVCCDRVQDNRGFSRA